MKYDTIKEATEAWLDQFDNIPGAIFQKLVDLGDEEARYYDSDSLRMIASRYVLCTCCGAHYEGDLSLSELREKQDNDEGVLCEYCEGNPKDGWERGYPNDFPVGWGTLFNIPRWDRDFIRDNAEKVAKLGFFIFDCEDFDMLLLGIDAGGFDFYEAYWIPLYKLRGFHWHKEAEEEDDHCPYCGCETEGRIFTCRTCGREGCLMCMPAGVGCECPKCEEDK